jgi:hypothetical protein
MTDGKYFSRPVSIRAGAVRFTYGGRDMKYLLLIYDEEQVWGKMNADEQEKMLNEYRQFGQELKSTGRFVAGNQLQPISTATSVRVRGGKRLVTDGPFAETREQLGGFYMIEAANLDEAIATAAKIPSARMGTIEVRPIVERPVPAPV